jgi:hypothetical protein
LKRIPASDPAEEELLGCIPHLRAFAWFLTKNRDRADDLVGNAIVRALRSGKQAHAEIRLKIGCLLVYATRTTKKCARALSDSVPPMTG